MTMKHYLILDKTNHVITSFTDKEKAEDYIKASPYLKVSEFDDSPDATDVPHHTETDDLPF
jgi:hypothetical protein